MIFKHLLLIASITLAGCGGGSSAVSTDVDAQSDASTSMIEPALFPAYSDDQGQVLALNAARESVIVTESGLQYEVLTLGEGSTPSADSNITVHYVGTLTDGTEFDSSYTRGEPATFQLSNTISGWVEGLQLMNVGSKYRFILPAELAYGEAGAGDVIGPNAALIFIVELLEINSM